mgnify:CR=1 FL=1
MPSVTLYGIPNCDTMKKARTWLAEHALEHVSLTDQLLGPSHHLFKTFLLQTVFELQGLQILGGKLVGSLGLQVCHDLT